MPWFYVDDGFSDSKPVLNMPDRYRLAACGLWVLAGSWSAKEELDGFVPTSKLRQLGARPPIVAALTDAGPMSAPLCTPVSGGIQFNSWEKWQPTKAELEAERIENARKREAEAERKRAERAAKNEQDPSSPRRRRKGRNAVTSKNSPIRIDESDKRPPGQTSDVQRDSRAHAGARLDPTRPDPTRSNSPGYVTESATESTAHDAIAATPAAELVRRTIPREIPSAVQTALRIQAGMLLKEHQAEIVEEALRDWAAKTGVGPGILPSLAADVIKRRNGYSRAAPAANGHDDKVNGYLAFANQPRQPEIEP